MQGHADRPHCPEQSGGKAGTVIKLNSAGFYDLHGAARHYSGVGNRIAPVRLSVQNLPGRLVAARLGQLDIEINRARLRCAQNKLRRHAKHSVDLSQCEVFADDAKRSGSFCQTEKVKIHGVVTAKDEELPPPRREALAADDLCDGKISGAG